MKYRFHEGIVYTKVSNVHLLIATRSAWDQFPSIKQISALHGVFCKGIDMGMTDEEVINAIILPRKMTREKVRDSYYSFVKKMSEEGYLIPGE